MSTYFPLLVLPPEIRNKILLFAVLSPYPELPIPLIETDINLLPLTNDPWSHHFHQPPLSLLLTSTHIYNEVHPLYYASHTFLLPISRQPKTLDPILTADFSHNLMGIRSLRIQIFRWGTKNFFVSTLIPKLEACILKGCLRRLEVLVKESDVESWVKEIERGYEGVESSNWIPLKGLCEDVDLEEVQLWSVKLILGHSPLGAPLKREYRNISWMLASPSRKSF